MSAAPLFELREVTVGGADAYRLRAVDARIPAAGVTAVVGPSGAGKTTLLRCCNRLVAPSSGQVSYRGRDVASLDPIELRRRVGMVFQRPTPFPGTVLDNLRVAAPDLDDARAGALLAAVHLDAGHLGRSADELSGGEAQRVCVARALATEPEVLLMDEPTSSRDAGPRGAVERLVGDLTARGVVVVWVTHDLGQMRRLADHVIVLVGGRVHQADRDRILDDAPPDVRAFLQEVDS